MAIIEDDRAPAPSPQSSTEQDEPHPLLSHPLASELMGCVVEWAGQEALGAPALEQLARLREVAWRMLEDSSQ